MPLIELEPPASIASASDLPKGWVMTTLGKAFRLNPPKPSRDVLPSDALVTFVRMPALDAESGSITTPTLRPFSEVRSSFTAFAENDVIMAKITPCMENGKAAIARGLMNRLGFGSTEFHIIRPTGTALPEFAYHFIRQASFRAQAEMEMTGSVGQRRVPADFLRDVEMPLPPLAEQRRIVAKLEQVLAAANAARERLTRVPALMKRFRQSVLAAACSGRLTADWREQNPDVESASRLLERILAERRARWETEQITKKRKHPKAMQHDLFFTKEEVSSIDHFTFNEVLLEANSAISEPSEQQSSDTDAGGSVVEQMFRKQQPSGSGDEVPELFSRRLRYDRNGYKEPAAPNISELPDLPEEWCWATIQQIAGVRGGLQKQPHRAPKINSYPYLRVANVLRGRLALDEVHSFELFSGELDIYRLLTNDLLIVEGNGSLSEIGRSAIWHGEIDDCVHQNHIIRVRIQTCLPEYVNLFWNSPVGADQVASSAVTSAGLYSLSVGKIAILPVALPPLAEQQEIVRRVEALFKFADAIEKRTATAADRAEKLTQALLARAFRGELVPTEADLARAEGRDYEPASVLLQRIHTEREQAATGRPAAKKRKGSAMNNDADHLFSSTRDAKDGYKTGEGK